MDLYVTLQLHFREFVYLNVKSHLPISHFMGPPVDRFLCKS